MIWLILIAVGIGLFFLAKYLEGTNFEEIYWYCGAWVSLLFGLIGTICILGYGILTYPELLKYKEEILSLKKNINFIKESTYKTEINKNNIINGSLDNFKQSTNLSKYLEKIAIREAYFNSTLINLKFKLNSRVYWWFSDNIFVDDRVLDLNKFE